MEKTTKQLILDYFLDDGVSVVGATAKQVREAIGRSARTVSAALSVMANQGLLSKHKRPGEQKIYGILSRRLCEQARDRLPKHACKGRCAKEQPIGLSQIEQARAARMDQQDAGGLSKEQIADAICNKIAYQESEIVRLKDELAKTKQQIRLASAEHANRMSEKNARIAELRDQIITLEQALKKAQVINRSTRSPLKVRDLLNTPSVR